MSIPSSATSVQAVVSCTPGIVLGPWVVHRQFFYISYFVFNTTPRNPHTHDVSSWPTAPISREPIPFQEYPSWLPQPRSWPTAPIHSDLPDLKLQPAKSA